MDLWRRRFGLVFIGGALLLLLLGLTVLEPRLRGLTFVFYWLACYGLTFLALLLAFIDLAVMRARSRQIRAALDAKTAESGRRP